MKINNPNIYLTSKQIVLSRTWSTQSESLERLLASGYCSGLTASRTLEREDWEQLSQQSKPRNTAMLFRKKRGPQRPNLLYWNSLAGQKELMFSYPDVCTGFWPFQRKAFPGDTIILFHSTDLHLYNAYGLQSFLDINIIWVSCSP